MAEKRQRLHCAIHGGYFYREPKRGRVPQACGGKNAMCDAATNAPIEQEPQTRKHRGARKDDFSARVVRDTEAAQVRNRQQVVDEGVAETYAKPSQRKAPAVNGANPSLSKGKAAKELLEAQGWDVTGKAWVAGNASGTETHYWASVTGARGEETLHIVWLDGEVQDQVYNLWNLDVPSKNGRPNANLPFDPDEIPDAELARYLVGVKVTWFNRLAGKEETAVCGRESIEIEHKWTGTGDEYPSARLIKFIDAEGGGYRHFRLEQLTKVG